MQFSINKIVSQTMGITINNFARVFLLPLLSIILSVIVGFVLAFLGAIAFSGSMVASIVVLIVILGISLTISGVMFNYFIRLGALGPSLAFVKDNNFAKIGFLNGLKFIPILLLSLLVISIVSAVLSMLGVKLTPEIPMDITIFKNEGFKAFYEHVKSVMPPYNIGMAADNLLSLVIISAIFSFFSANLSKTALGDDVSDYETPHTMDFAVVLLIINLVSFIPVTIFSLLQFENVAMGVSILAGFVVSSAIAIAHGVRHRMCAPAEADIEYQAMSGPSEEPSDPPSADE